MFREIMFFFNTESYALLAKLVSSNSLGLAVMNLKVTNANNDNNKHKEIDNLISGFFKLQFLQKWNIWKS